MLIFVQCSLLNAQSESTPEDIFQIVDPNYTLSPYTGMTKKHWEDAALYLLEGAFGYVSDIDDPLKFPKQPGKSYPTEESQVPTEKLEGLCRTLFVASPILKKNPELEINGINIAEYYRYNISKLVNPQSEEYITPRPKDGGPHQNLVEYGALSISFMVNPEVLWDPLPQTVKDSLASNMLSYGDGPTVPSNWKFFNIFVLSFFKSQGYEVNEKLLEEYLEKSLEHYVGQGWYNDNPAYDYYSMWAFQMYGMLWGEFFGKQHYPEITARFHKNFGELLDNYPYMFSRNGEMIMWGRSISYRMGSIVPFPLAGWYPENKNVNFGWLRRISSGVIKQFFQHPDFMEDGVPTLGFYGAFEPAVQIYSCRGSVYWMGKAFLGLLVPDDNPFWTAIENEGPWEDKFDDKAVYNKFQEGSNILITDYPAIGASEIRAWCHERVATDWQKFRSSENYNKLSYNSAFPWQADGKDGIVSMNYAFLNEKQEWEVFRLYTFKKFEDGIYYRDAVLETDDDIKFKLADIPLPNGILRVDRNLSEKRVKMRLGHYALPDLNRKMNISTEEVGGYKATIIDNGVYQLAMVPLKGWTNAEVEHAVGLHPEGEKSSVINVLDESDPDDGDNVYATLMLWKKSGEKWKKKDLLPITKMEITPQEIRIVFKSKEEKKIVFD